VPVVATSVGVAREVINKSNGLLVEPGDEKAMTDALFQMMDLCREFDKTIIRQGLADKYSKESVGKDIMSLYKDMLSKGRG
jgi:glycosyltransferase involved in cell wall biosynthesis